MNDKHDLRSLTQLGDDELLRRLSDLLMQSRRVESVLVAREAFPSMFQYCVDALHLSKAEAYLRIEAARASRRFPVLLTMLADGRLHLSDLVVVAPHLTRANCEELLARSTHQTKAAIKEIVVEMKPLPDVQGSMRKLPQGN